jgi:hypothetical protein
VPSQKLWLFYIRTVKGLFWENVFVYLEGEGGGECHETDKVRVHCAKALGPQGNYTVSTGK